MTNCIYCKKPLRKFTKAYDWDNRKYHRKCWIEKQDIEYILSMFGPEFTQQMKEINQPIQFPHLIDPSPYMPSGKPFPVLLKIPYNDCKIPKKPHYRIYQSEKSNI